MWQAPSPPAEARRGTEATKDSINAEGYLVPPAPAPAAKDGGGAHVKESLATTNAFVPGMGQSSGTGKSGGESTAAGASGLHSNTLTHGMSASRVPALRWRGLGGHQAGLSPTVSLLPWGNASGGLGTLPSRWAHGVTGPPGPGGAGVFPPAGLAPAGGAGPPAGVPLDDARGVNLDAPHSSGGGSGSGQLRSSEGSGPDGSGGARPPAASQAAEPASAVELGPGAVSARETRPPDRAPPPADPAGDLAMERDLMGDGRGGGGLPLRALSPGGIGALMGERENSSEGAGRHESNQSGRAKEALGAPAADAGAGAGAGGRRGERDGDDSAGESASELTTLRGRNAVAVMMTGGPEGDGAARGAAAHDGKFPRRPQGRGRGRGRGPGAAGDTEAESQDPRRRLTAGPTRMLADLRDDDAGDDDDVAGSDSDGPDGPGGDGPGDFGPRASLRKRSAALTRANMNALSEMWGVDRQDEGRRGPSPPLYQHPAPVAKARGTRSRRIHHPAPPGAHFVKIKDIKKDIEGQRVLIWWPEGQEDSCVGDRPGEGARPGAGSERPRSGGTGQRGQWWVASVGRVRVKQRVADVAYDTGDFETGVDIGTLVQNREVLWYDPGTMGGGHETIAPGALVFEGGEGAGRGRASRDGTGAHQPPAPLTKLLRDPPPLGRLPPAGELAGAAVARPPRRAAAAAPLRMPPASGAGSGMGGVSMSGLSGLLASDQIGAAIASEGGIGAESTGPGGLPGGQGPAAPGARDLGSSQGPGGRASGEAGAERRPGSAALPAGGGSDPAPANPADTPKVLATAWAPGLWAASGTEGAGAGALGATLSLGQLPGVGVHLPSVDVGWGAALARDSAGDPPSSRGTGAGAGRRGSGGAAMPEGLVRMRVKDIKQSLVGRHIWVLKSSEALWHEALVVALKSAARECIVKYAESGLQRTLDLGRAVRSGRVAVALGQGGVLSGPVPSGLVPAPPAGAQAAPERAAGTGSPWRGAGKRRRGPAPADAAPAGPRQRPRLSEHDSNIDEGGVSVAGGGPGAADTGFASKWSPGKGPRPGSPPLAGLPGDRPGGPPRLPPHRRAAPGPGTPAGSLPTAAVGPGQKGSVQPTGDTVGPYAAAALGLAALDPTAVAGPPPPQLQSTFPTGAHLPPFLPLHLRLTLPPAKTQALSGGPGRHDRPPRHGSPGGGRRAGGHRAGGAHPAPLPGGAGRHAPRAGPPGAPPPGHLRSESPAIPVPGEGSTGGAPSGLTHTGLTNPTTTDSLGWRGSFGLGGMSAMGGMGMGRTSLDLGLADGMGAEPGRAFAGSPWDDEAAPQGLNDVMDEEELREGLARPLEEKNVDLWSMPDIDRMEF